MSAGDLSGLDRVSAESWSALRKRRIYFGHQSVGYNIIEGVEAILREKPTIGLAVRDSGDPKALEAPGLTHSKIGSNCDPLSKVQAFSNLMHAGAGERADAALFKLCYVDIGDRTDPRQVFEQYAKTMDVLQSRFPGVCFLHCTCPITAIPGGLKNSIKKLVGRPIWGYEHNRRRELFNALMRDKYASTGWLFDIARLECTRPDGGLETFEWQGSHHEAMFQGYTNDGGHLGPVGQRVVAREFLSFLAGASE